MDSSNSNQRFLDMSDSTLVMKDDAGQDIRLTILRTPIDLGTVNVVHEDNTNKQTANMEGTSQRKAKIKANSKIKKDKKFNSGTVKYRGNVSRHNKNLKSKLKVNTKMQAREKINKSIVNRNNVKDSLRRDVKEESDTIKVPPLKNPIPISIQCNQDTSDEPKTFKARKVKNVRKKDYSLKLKKKRNTLELETWKRNALIIFQNSFVYPFIHMGSKYKCFVCAKLYLDVNNLRQHTIYDHSIEDMRNVLTNRVRDKELKVDVSCLQCKICMGTSSNIQNLKIHLRQHGKQIDMATVDNLIPFKLGGSVFDCQICGEQFLKLRVLIIHMSKHFNNFSCEVCGSAFISLKLLKRHQQVHSSGSYPCQSCDKVFNTSSKRSIHYRGVHLKKFPRICPMCPERFNSNYQRAKHLRVVHNLTTGVYRCETCSREYDLKCHLLVHIRSVHLHERNHKCHVCKSGFFSKCSLARHMVVHEGEKIHKCTYCEKAFSRQNCLLEHVKTHQGLAIYVDTIDDVVRDLTSIDAEGSL